LGVKQIDLLFVSHYHFDHIGCIPAVLQQFPLQGDAYDRGESYPGTTFTNYKAAVGVRPVGRQLADGEAVHQSALDRMKLEKCQYAPQNLASAGTVKAVDTTRIARGTPCPDLPA